MLVGKKKDYSEMEQVLNTARFHQGHLHCGTAVIWFLELIAVILKQLNTTLDKSGKEQLQAAEIKPWNGTKASGRVQGAFLDWALNLPLAFT